jgi:Phosphopantetheine attachment site.
VLAGIMGIEQVSVDSHLFYDLGADSLVITTFCARLRTRADLPPISTKEVYQRPTVRSLAAALTDAGPAPSRAAESAPAPAKGRLSVLRSIFCAERCSS